MEGSDGMAERNSEVLFLIIELNSTGYDTSGKAKRRLT